MPKLQADLVDQGVSFANAFVVNPWCCPSRASILTGQHSHTHGVYKNEQPYGGFESFRDDSNLATWLDNAGYRTGLIGKYFNGYLSDYIPPGWDRWAALTAKPFNFYNYEMNVDGATQTYGDASSDYKTDVLGGFASKFIRETPRGHPLFLHFTPNAPHGPPKPAPRHRSAFSKLSPWRPPNYNESDVGDKPSHIQALSSSNTSDNLRSAQYRTLLAVDDAVGEIVNALRDTGRLSNTVILFASDNGLSWGEHRWHGKKVLPYEEDIRIPLVIRFDPLTGSVARADSNLVLNVDFAPTIAELTGAAAGGAEGQSLVPLLSGGNEVPWRSDFLIEHLQGGLALASTVPTYCGVRSKDFAYTVYDTGERELYDLRNDPYQLQNRSADPAFEGIVATLHERLRQLCDPPPPGFSLP